jgi:hypothetical protein
LRVEQDDQLQSAAKIGPIFVASPFNFEVKGFSTHIWGQPLIDALEEGGIEVHHMPNEVVSLNFPAPSKGYLNTMH